MMITLTMTQIVMWTSILLIPITSILLYKAKREWVWGTSFTLLIFSVVTFVASIVFQSHDSRRQAHDLKLAELPVKWQKFYNFADKISNRQMKIAALNKFLKNDPPQLTVENYETLIGTGLYIPQKSVIGHLIENDQDIIANLVILDYDFAGEE